LWRWKRKKRTVHVHKNVFLLITNLFNERHVPLNLVRLRSGQRFCEIETILLSSRFLNKLFYEACKYLKEWKWSGYNTCKFSERVPLFKWPLQLWPTLKLTDSYVSINWRYPLTIFLEKMHLYKGCKKQENISLKC